MEGRINMKKAFGGALLAFAVVLGIVSTTSVTANAQSNWELANGANDPAYRQRRAEEERRDRDRNGRDRDWNNRNRRNDDNNRSRVYRNRGYGNNGGYNNSSQYELNRGYQQGVNTGASDAQRGQSYSPQRSRYYNTSSQAFRQGFVRGYDQGYRQYAGYNNGRYGNGTYNNGRYGNGRYGTGGYGGYGNQAELNRGYQQGLETGSSDGQRGQSYDPQRSKHWRNASSQEFREGFVRGYDQGYRQYAGNGGYRRNGGGIGDILGGILGGRP